MSVNILQNVHDHLLSWKILNTTECKLSGAHTCYADDNSFPRYYRLFPI